MLYRPKTVTCAHVRSRAVKHDSIEMQRRILHFRGRFEWFETISAENKPENVKNVLKMRFFSGLSGYPIIDSFLLRFSVTCKVQNPTNKLHFPLLWIIIMTRASERWKNKQKPKKNGSKFDGVEVNCCLYVWRSHLIERYCYADLTLH